MDTEVPSLESVQNLIYKEALKCFTKMGHQDLYEVEDLFQEGVIQYFDAAKRWNFAKAKFTTYLTMWLQAYFANVLSSFQSKRNRVVCVEEPECQDREHMKELCWDDVVILAPLSTNSRAFLECLFSPPPELLDIIQERKQKMKTWSDDIRIPICTLLGFTSEDYAQIKVEIREKLLLR